MKNSDYQIECRDLTLSYDGKAVLDSASFYVRKGDYLCVIGENGSGKSTLAKALLSLKKPSAGEIIFGNGTKPGSIGYLPQQTNISRDFPATVREVVLSGLLGSKGFRPFYSKSGKEKARLCMERMGIYDIAKKKYSELSGGQMQRTLLARALCAAEDLILLDEPVNGLDPVVTKEFYRIIKELNDTGMTIIMISHDLAAALKYAKTILHLDRQVKFFGDKEEYIRSSDFGSFSGGDAI
ncbi:MAG: metal ABC transporter ATP-binding protein [Clostridia bacterium]|nr:metal ABC transporter ATP-binding protein [Clostridia bacterium]